MEVTDQLDVDLQRAGYTFETDVSHMTIEDLVTRLEARHRFFASAFRAARGPVPADPGETARAGLEPRRTPPRPATWDAMMELVGRLKGDNVRWKEIRERVEAEYGYRCDSEEALRKHFERWQKGRKSAG